MNKQQLTDALTEGIREGRINPAEREEALALYQLIYEDGTVVRLMRIPPLTPAYVR